jgi:hypothetical protein
MATSTRFSLRIGAILALAIGTGNSGVAHHSFAVYDFSQQIPFEGVVDTLNFKNPHIAMTLTHVTETGETETIHFIEGAPANMLVRNGLRPEMIKPGTKVTAIGSPLREDPTQFFLRRVRLEDGREFE